MSDRLSELRERVLKSKTARKKTNPAEGSSTSREEGELEEYESDPPAARSGKTDAESAFKEPYRPNKRPNLQQEGLQSNGEPRDNINHAIPSTNKYGQSNNYYRSVDPIMNAYPYAHIPPPFYGYPALHPPPSFVGQGMGFAMYQGYGGHPGMIGPPPHLPPPYGHQMAQAVATPIKKSHTQTNGSRPTLQQAAVSNDLVFECLIPDDCQFKDTPVSQLISNFKEGQLAPHGQVIACMKILQLLGERGETIESLESHQITLDMLKSTGIVLSQSAAQPKIVTSTPGPQIDKNFAANRVNTLLLSNEISSHDFATSKDAARKTLKQLSQCGSNTIVALVNFNGYVQASDAVVGLSELLDILEIYYAPDSSNAANVHLSIQTGQPTIDKLCIVESRSYHCPNLGCSFKHRCDDGMATEKDVKNLLWQLHMLYPNPKSFVRVRIDGMVKLLQEKAATSSQILCQIRRTYRSGWENETLDADPPQSPAVETRMEESEEEIVEDSNFSLKNTLFFKDLEHFLSTKSAKFEGMFSKYLGISNIPDTAAFEVFSALVVEVKAKGVVSETFASLSRMLSQSCDLLIVWKLYYALSLFYNIPASKALIEKAFLKFPDSSLLHLLVYLAHPSISDKALILQLTMQNAAGKQHASNTILNGLINLLAVLDSTRTSPVAIAGHYACLLIHPNPPVGLKKLLTADPANFPSDFPIQSFVSDELQGEDFMFCWLVFIYYLGFHGLPPIFASAPFSSCVRPCLFLIKWDQAPKDCVKGHLAPLLRVFSELTNQWLILQGRSLNGLIALLRNYVAFARIFAPHKLPEIEKILQGIRTTYGSLAEIHELIFQVMQAQSKSVPKRFWMAALERTSSAGLANFYISTTRGSPQFPAALNLAARYLATDDSPCYFSWIIRAKLILESDASHRVLDSLHKLFKRSFTTFSDPHVLELLHLDYLRCVYHVHPTNGYLVALGLLDETLADSPASYIPIQLGSVAEKGIAKSHDFSLVEKTLDLVASWSDSNDVALEIFKSGCVSFPGSFYLTQRLCDIESEDLYQVATNFIIHFPTDRLAWNVILKHGLVDTTVSPNLDELLLSNKASFPVSPHLLSLSLFL